MAIPPVSPDGPTLTIRKFQRAYFTLDALVKIGSVSEPMADKLRSIVCSQRANPEAFDLVNALNTGHAGSDGRRGVSQLLLVDGRDSVTDVFGTSNPVFQTMKNETSDSIHN